MDPKTAPQRAFWRRIAKNVVKAVETWCEGKQLTGRSSRWTKASTWPASVSGIAKIRGYSTGKTKKIGKQTRQLRPNARSARYSSALSRRKTAANAGGTYTRTYRKTKARTYGIRAS